MSNFLTCSAKESLAIPGSWDRKHHDD